MTLKSCCHSACNSLRFKGGTYLFAEGNGHQRGFHFLSAYRMIPSVQHACSRRCLAAYLDWHMLGPAGWASQLEPRLYLNPWAFHVHPESGTRSFTMYSHTGYVDWSPRIPVGVVSTTSRSSGSLYQLIRPGAAAIHTKFVKNNYNLQQHWYY